MEDPVQTDEIYSITVVDYQVLHKVTEYVEYKLNVVGTTNYLHKMAYFDRNACVPLEKPIFTVMARYSSLLDIHNGLVIEVKGAPLPEFPPKRWVRNTSESSIRERIAKLNHYFAELLSFKYVRKTVTLSQAFGPKVSLNFAVIGSPHIGNKGFIDGFLLATPSLRYCKIEIDPTQSQTFCIHRPIDLVVDRVLVRINRIELIALIPDLNLDDIATGLSSFDAVILIYAGSGTQELMHEVSVLLQQPFTAISLGTGDSNLAGSEIVDVRDEAFDVLEQLVRRCLKQTQA
jgi:hypothetical protein